MENCRVLLVGDRGVGKTSLIRRFLGEEFQQVSQSVFIIYYIVYYILYYIMYYIVYYIVYYIE